MKSGFFSLEEGGGGGGYATLLPLPPTRTVGWVDKNDEGTRWIQSTVKVDFVDIFVSDTVTSRVIRPVFAGSESELC